LCYCFVLLRKESSEVGEEERGRGRRKGGWRGERGRRKGAGEGRGRRKDHHRPCAIARTAIEGIQRGKERGGSRERERERGGEGREGRGRRRRGSECQPIGLQGPPGREGRR
jgi:hypothetical protein